MDGDDVPGLSLLGPPDAPPPGGAWTIVGSGEIDLVSAHLLLEAIDLAIAKGATLVVLDATSIVFVDSSGLRAIVSAGQRMASADGRLLIDGMSGAVQRVLEISGLIDRYRS